MYHREELNELKNKGFYLDIQDGTVKSSPYDIDEKMLENIQDLTDAILETIQKMIRKPFFTDRYSKAAPKSRGHNT
jgi:hypothetical protein